MSCGWPRHLEMSVFAVAGVELDRHDLNLGTPPHTKIIASSGGHSRQLRAGDGRAAVRVSGLTGSIDYRIRADMTFIAAPNDGAVFSTGSIGYGQALPANGFMSRLLANVVNAFLKPGALPGSYLDGRGKAMAVAKPR